MKFLTRGLLILLLYTVTGSIFAGQENTQPNIVFILADDLGWADLPSYGNQFNEAPHLDQLAAEGMRFDNAYAANPVCSPSRASLLTGQHPARLGINDFIPGHWPHMSCWIHHAIPACIFRWIW